MKNKKMEIVELNETTLTGKASFSYDGTSQISSIESMINKVCETGKDELPQYLQHLKMERDDIGKIKTCKHPNGITDVNFQFELKSQR